MCKAVDAFLSALKYISDWLVLSKKLEIVDVLFCNDDVGLDYMTLILLHSLVWYGHEYHRP